MCANSGAQRAIGSSSANRPSSTSMSAAVEVIGFVIEAMRKMVSRSIGNPGLHVPPANARVLDHLAVAPHQRRRAGKRAGVDDRA